MARKELELQVIASSLEGGGDAKMCAENMGALGLSDGDEVEVQKGKYSVLLYVHEDTIYDPDSIRMRTEDIFLLSAREGDAIQVFLPGAAEKKVPAKKSAPAKKAAPKKKKARKRKASKKRKRSKKKGKKK